MMNRGFPEVSALATVPSTLSWSTALRYPRRRNTALVLRMRAFSTKRTKVPLCKHGLRRFPLPVISFIGVMIP